MLLSLAKSTGRPDDQGLDQPLDQAAAPAAAGVAGEADGDLDHDFSRTLAALGGVAARSRLHALHPARPGDQGAATGFALALLSHLAALAGRAHTGAHTRLRRPRPLLWVQDRGARQEGGQPYGLGFGALGLDPAQFVIVSTRNALDALAATEIGLEIGGLDGVLAELPRQLPADMLALGKRLALRAERSGVPCLLLHASAAPIPAPVATRWQIASRPAVPDGADGTRVSESEWGASVPAAALVLLKNRFGPTGRWRVPLRPPALEMAPRPNSNPGPNPDLSSGVPDVRITSLSPPVSQLVDAVPLHRPGAPPARPAAA